MCKQIIIIISSSCHTTHSLSLTIRPYHPSLPEGLPDYILCPYKAIVDRFLLVTQHLHVRVKRFHRCTSLMNLSLLLQQCPACLVRLIWMVFKMGGRWSYSCCFVECCFQDLFSIAHSILVQLPSSFFSMHFFSVPVVHPYSRTDTTAA